MRLALERNAEFQGRPFERGLAGIECALPQHGRMPSRLQARVEQRAMPRWTAHVEAGDDAHHFHGQPLYVGAHPTHWSGWYDGGLHSKISTRCLSRPTEQGPLVFCS